MFTGALNYHDFGYNCPPIVSVETEPPAHPTRTHRIFGVILLAAWILFTTPAAWHFDAITRVALIGLVLGAVLAIALPRAARGLENALVAIPRWVFLVATCAIATGASAYVAFAILRGLPLSIDASVYLFEARALSHFHFGMPFPGPRLSFGDRFLFEGADGNLHGVFPPGYPLFLAPFTSIGVPIAAGPVTAALLVLAHYTVGLAMTRDERATRFAVLLSLPAYARAIETADLLSHAFVAVLGSFALALAMSLRAKPRWLPALALGLCIGWAFASRLLDGILFGLFALGIVVSAPWLRRNGSAMRAMLVAGSVLAGVLPFAILLGAQQLAATGSVRIPTQHEYFAHSDYPANCHRLGFGRDVGCYVEHPDESTRFQHTGGYTLREGLRVTRERASLFSLEVFGSVLLAWACFAILVWRPRRRDLALGTIVVTFTATYALFYYGNAVLHGARHLFPVQPYLTLLAARAALGVTSRREGRFDTAHLRGIASFALVGSILGAAILAWPVYLAVIDSAERPRVDICAFVRRHRITDGMVIVNDHFAWTSAFDPYRDGAQLVPVMNDGVGLRELRRARPDLVPYFILPHGEIGRPMFPPPPADIRIEIDRAWPSFQTVDRLGARSVSTTRHVHLPSSGDAALLVFASEPDATFRFRFDLGNGGTYVPHVEGFAGPAFGDYEFTLDGHPLAPWHGFDATTHALRGDDGAPIAIGSGTHEFVARCTGHDAHSAGYLALWDSLVLVPTE